MVATTRFEPSGRKASTLPMRHRAQHKSVNISARNYTLYAFAMCYTANEEIYTALYQYFVKYRCFLRMGGDLAPNLGGNKNFFRGPISGKISIFRVKISDDLFLVIDLVLRIF